jgi:hypothetical protein
MLKPGVLAVVMAVVVSVESAGGVDRRFASTPDQAETTDGPSLKVEKLRLDPSPKEAPQPSALLKFDVLNDTRSRLADVVMRVSFVERDTHEIEASPARVLVGPFTIRVHETLPAGYVLSYELLFRNLSPECDCSPRVEILSAHVLSD